MLQGPADPLLAYNLVGIAARLAHAIGLHLWLDSIGLSEDQIDERRWVSGCFTCWTKVSAFRLDVSQSYTIRISALRYLKNRMESFSRAEDGSSTLSILQQNLQLLKAGFTPNYIRCDHEL